jgi:CPA2 family monovalent cation:H+ antiporter-2
MAGWELLLDLIITISAAFALGLVFERLKVGAVVGYILGGLAVGPTAFGLIAESETVHSLAEIGIALLLFTTGLEFSFHRLKKLGRRVLLGGTLQIVVNIVLFAGVALAFRANWKEALAIGMIVCVSSTAIVLRVLRDRGDLDASHGKIAFGILIMQDVALVPLVLGITFLGNRSEAISWDKLLPNALIFLAAVAGFYFLLRKVLPRVLHSRAMTSNRDLPIMLGLLTCLSSAWLAHHFGLSASLGAFLAGVILADSVFEPQIRSDITPFRALFGTLFFASVGMLADLTWISKNFGMVAVATVLLVAGKLLANFLAIRGAKNRTIPSAAASFSLAHVGELGFVLIPIAIAGQVLSEVNAQLVTSAAVLSMMVAPIMVRHSPRAARSLAKRLVPKRKLAREELEERRAKLTGHFVVAGYGTSGSAAAEYLAQGGISSLIIDLDANVLKAARDAGHHAKLGDATQIDMLMEANVQDALGMIVALPEHRAASLIIAHARALDPDLLIVARARYHAYAGELREAGATHVVSEERLLGETLAEEALEHLSGD